MSPNPAGKKWVTAQSKTSFVSGGSVRNAVCVSLQCDPTIFVICMRFNLSGEKSIRRGSRFARRSIDSLSPARLICCPHRLDRPSRSRPRLDCISAASRSARPLQHSSQVVVPTHRPCRSPQSLHCISAASRSARPLQHTLPKSWSQPTGHVAHPSRSIADCEPSETRRMTDYL